MKTSNLLVGSLNFLLLGGDFFVQLTDEWLLLLYLIFLHLLVSQQTLQGVVHVLEMESDTRTHKHTKAHKSTQKHTKAHKSKAQRHAHTQTFMRGQFHRMTQIDKSCWASLFMA